MHVTRITSPRKHVRSRINQAALRAQEHKAMGQIIFASVGIYLALGIFFAVYFVISGVARMDPVAKGSPVTFKALIIPGSIALWPLLAYKLIRRRGVQ